MAIFSGKLYFIVLYCIEALKLSQRQFTISQTSKSWNVAVIAMEAFPYESCSFEPGTGKIKNKREKTVTVAGLPTN